MKRDAARGLKRLLAQGIVEDTERPRPMVAPDQEALVPIESIAVNITRRCNLRCAFCYNLGKPPASGVAELSVEEISSFLASVRTLLAAKPALVLLGGEPLLSGDKVISVAKAGRKLGMQSLVSTNGTFVTDDFARDARKAGLQVQVSLDGHDAALNDAVRGQGAFDRTVHGVKVLLRHKVHTILSMVCHEGNVHGLENYYQFARELGVNEARFIPLKPIGGGSEGTFRPVSVARLVRDAFRLFDRHPEYARLAGRDHLSIMAQVCRLSARRVSCGVGRQTFLLDADGTIYPCLNSDVAEFRAGNIRDPDFDFARVWRESHVLREVRRRTCIDGMNEDCAKCVLRYWCLGGCRGETYCRGGDLGGRSEDCEDLRKAMLETMWLVAQRPDLFKPSSIVC
jgi:radical SAM protein with 4Fe4S-binding SPASM domain